jgi:DNA repair protein RecO (recombination protein O)
LSTTGDERVYKTEGIVLHHADVGEADRMITLFTPFRGKVRGVAKGSRKPTSRLAGHIEQFTHTSVVIARGRNIDIITQAQTVRSFIEIRENLRLFMYASYAAELVERSSEWESENRPLYGLLERMLVHLITTHRFDATLHAFELEALAIQGYQPQLDKCVVCSNELNRSVVNGFSSTAGGALCPTCRVREPDQRELSAATLSVLRRLQSGGLAAADSVRMSPDTRSETESILSEYIAARLEHDLNSANVLRSLRRQIAAYGV